MKLNEDKCHLLVGGYKHESIWAKIGDARIWESNKQKQLGTSIKTEHYSLTKAGRSLSVLASFSSFMTLTQR